MRTKKQNKTNRNKGKRLIVHEYDFAYFSRCDHDEFTEYSEGVYSVFFNPVAFISPTPLSDNQVDLLFKSGAPFFNIRVVSSHKREINATYENCLFDGQHEESKDKNSENEDARFVSTYCFYPTAPGFIELELDDGKKYKVYWEASSDNKKVIISDFAKRKALFCPYTLKLGEIMCSEDAKVYKAFAKAKKALKQSTSSRLEKSKVIDFVNASEAYERRRTIYLANLTADAPIKID